MRLLFKGGSYSRVYGIPHPKLHVLVVDFSLVDTTREKASLNFVLLKLSIWIWLMEDCGTVDKRVLEVIRKCCYQ